MGMVLNQDVSGIGEKARSNDYDIEAYLWDLTKIRYGTYLNEFQVR